MQKDLAYKPANLSRLWAPVRKHKITTFITTPLMSEPFQVFESAPPSVPSASPDTVTRGGDDERKLNVYTKGKEEIEETYVKQGNPGLTFIFLLF